MARKKTQRDIELGQGWAGTAEGAEIFMPVRVRGCASWTMEIELGDEVRVRVGAGADLVMLIEALRELGGERC